MTREQLEAFAEHFGTELNGKTLAVCERLCGEPCDHQLVVASAEEDTHDWLQVESDATGPADDVPDLRATGRSRGRWSQLADRLAVALGF
jgi:hypothetical protein